MTKQKIWAACELYTGLKATKVDVVEDPKISNCFAIRAEFGRSYVLTFLIKEGREKQTVKWISDNLEEVEYKTWPPTSTGC